LYYLTLHEEASNRLRRPNVRYLDFAMSRFSELVTKIPACTYDIKTTLFQLIFFDGGENISSFFEFLGFKRKCSRYG